MRTADFFCVECFTLYKILIKGNVQKMKRACKYCKHDIVNFTGNAQLVVDNMTDKFGYVDEENNDLIRTREKGRDGLTCKKCGIGTALAWCPFCEIDDETAGDC